MNRWTVVILGAALASGCASSKPAPATAPSSQASTAAEAPAAVDPLVPPPRKADADRKSKNGRLEAKIGGVDVIVQYGRPKVRGRTIFGELVPYGKLWRTGADEATTLTVKANCKIEGQKLNAGTYSLFTVPGADKWTVVVNRAAAQWGAYRHADAEDVFRVEVTPAASELTEEMTFTAEGDALVLAWEKVRVPIRIAADQ